MPEKKIIKIGEIILGIRDNQSYTIENFMKNLNEMGTFFQKYINCTRII